MLPLIFWALAALCYAHAYSQTRLAGTLLATATAYGFLPGYLFLACPLIAYNSLLRRIFTATTRQKLPFILCVLAVSSWAAGASISDGMHFLADAVFDPYETIIEPFIEAFHDGLDTINFQEGLAQDKKELASLWPVAINLIATPSTVYRAVVESQSNVRANIADVPTRFFGLSICSPKSLFVSNMHIILVVLALIIVYRWFASRSGSAERVDLIKQCAVNAEVFAFIKAQDVQVDVADANVCAIHARCETLLSYVWVNVFCPGARRHIQVLEMESIPRRLPNRRPRASTDAMSNLRHRLGVRPGLNMPTARQVDAFDPMKKYAALDAIRSENSNVLKSLEEEEYRLLALEQRLEQLNIAIQEDASNGHPQGRRGLLAWTLADSEPDLQRYGDYLALKQQNLTAPHLETFQKYEFYLASGQQYRLPLALMSQEPPSPISPISRFSESIESQWSNVQKSFCITGQAPIQQPTSRTTIYNRAGKYTFPGSRPAIPERDTFTANASKPSASGDHENVYRHRRACPRQVRVKLDSILPDTDFDAVSSAVLDSETSKARPQPSVPKPIYKAEARQTKSSVDKNSLQAKPAQRSDVGKGKAKAVPSKPIPAPEPFHEYENPTDASKPLRADRTSSGSSSAAEPTGKSHTAAEPKHKAEKAAASINADYFEKALEAFSGLRLEDLPPLPPSPTLLDAPLPPLPPFPTKPSTKQPYKSTTKAKAVVKDVAVTHRSQTRHNVLPRSVVNSEDLQQRQSAAEIERIYSSIPQHICLGGWPKRYLQRRACKATCRESSIYRRFHSRVERTWTRRARGGRRVETQPSSIKPNATILKSIEEAPTEALDDTPGPAYIYGPASTAATVSTKTPQASPAGMSDEGLTDALGGVSFEDPADVSAEDLADAPASAPAATSGEELSDAVLDDLADVSNEDMKDAPTDAPITASTDILSGASVHIPADVSAEDLADAPTDTSTGDIRDTVADISTGISTEDLTEALPATAAEVSVDILGESLADALARTDYQPDMRIVVVDPITGSDEAAIESSLDDIATGTPTIQASASNGDAAKNVSDEDDKEFWRELFGMSPEPSDDGSDDDDSEDAIVHEGDIIDTDFASDLEFNIQKKGPARAARLKASPSTSAPAQTSLSARPLPADPLPMPAPPIAPVSAPLQRILPPLYLPADHFPMPAPPEVPAPTPALIPTPSQEQQSLLPSLPSDPIVAVEDGAPELTECEIDEFNSYLRGDIGLDEITVGQGQAAPETKLDDQNTKSLITQQGDAKSTQPHRVQFTFDLQLTGPNPFMSQSKSMAASLPTALALPAFPILPQPTPTTDTADESLVTDSDIAQLEAYLNGDIDSDDLDEDEDQCANDKTKTAEATKPGPVQFSFNFQPPTTNPFTRQSTDLPATRTPPQSTIKASIDDKPLIEDNKIDILEAYIRGEVELYDLTHDQGQPGAQSSLGVVAETSPDEQAKRAPESGKADGLEVRLQQPGLIDQAQHISDNTASGQPQALPTTDILSEFLDSTSRPEKLGSALAYVGAAQNVDAQEAQSDLGNTSSDQPQAPPTTDAHDESSTSRLQELEYAIAYLDAASRFDVEDAQPLSGNSASDQAREPPIVDALSEFLDATSRPELPASTSSLLNAECNVENQEAGAQDNSSGRSLTSILETDISDYNLFPLGYFDSLSATNFESYNATGASDIGVPDFTVSQPGSWGLSKVDTGVFDYGASDFDNDAFNPSITAGLNLDVFNVPGDGDSGAEDGNDDEYAATVKEAVADLNSQPDLFPLQLLLDAGLSSGVVAGTGAGAGAGTGDGASACPGVSLISTDTDAETAFMADSVAEYNTQHDLFPLDMHMDFGQYHAGDVGRHEGDEEVPVEDLKLLSSYLQSTDDADSEEDAAFIEATGMHTVADTERDDMFGLNLLRAATDGEDDGLYAHDQGEDGAFDAGTMAKFGLEAGSTEEEVAEPSNIPTSAMPHGSGIAVEPAASVQGYPGNADAELANAPQDVNLKEHFDS